MVVIYGPNQGDVEEREKFWNDLDRVVDMVGNGYRLCVLGDLKAWDRDRMRVGIIGGFGVVGENDK